MRLILAGSMSPGCRLAGRRRRSWATRIPTCSPRSACTRGWHAACAAMQRGGGVVMPRAGRRVMPAIVFHGERDTTVHPRNGDAVVAQAERDSMLAVRVEAGQVPGGHAYSKTRYVNASGKTVIEKWLGHGARHGWL